MNITSSYATNPRPLGGFAKTATEPNHTPRALDGFIASAILKPPASPRQAVSSHANQLATAVEATVTAAPPSIDIKTVQDQLTAGLPGLGVSFANIDEFGKLNGRLTTIGELKEMMAALYDESSIPFGYIIDGCYSRAHMMDESLRQHGINNAKMFCKGDLEASNDLMEARWWYHVAPLVFVDMGDGKPVPKIVDPGFSREPLDPEQWVKTMNRGPNVEIDLVSAEQYYPREGAADEDFAASLGPSISTAQSYSRRLWGVKKAKGLPVDPYQKPTWNKPGSGGDYSLNGKTETIFPEGIAAGAEPEYRLSTALNGTLLLEPMPERAVVSAAWDKRPAGFDPYKAR
jgi:hypothetical protein